MLKLFIFVLFISCSISQHEDHTLDYHLVSANEKHKYINDDVRISSTYSYDDGKIDWTHFCSAIVLDTKAHLVMLPAHCLDTRWSGPDSDLRVSKYKIRTIEIFKENMDFKGSRMVAMKIVQKDNN